VAGAGEVRFLLPGQTIRASQDGQLSEVTSMPVDAMASWLSGRLAVDNTALSEVLAELARYGDTGLQVHDEAVGRLAVTASVNLRDPQGFARSLPRVLPVKLRPLANGGTEIIAAK
jgi:transmembrane sensor